MRIKHKSKKYKKLRTTLKTDILRMLKISDRFETESEGYFSKTELQMIKNAIEELHNDFNNSIDFNDSNEKNKKEII